MTEPVQMPLSDRVLHARIAKGLSTQALLAKAAKVGQGSISEIESGKTKSANVKAETLIKIAKALGTTAEELYSGAPPAATQAGIDGDRALSLLKLMRAPTREAWFHNAAALLALQGSVKIARRERHLHNDDSPGSPANKQAADAREKPLKGPTPYDKLVAKYGENAAERIINELVEQDVGGETGKPDRHLGGKAKQSRKRAAKTAGVSQSPVTKPAETGERGLDE